MDEALEPAVAQAQRLEHLEALLAGELRGLGLELHAHADDLGAAAELGLDRGDDLGDAVEVALAHVDQRHHRLVGEEELLLQHGALVGGEVASVDRRALGEHDCGRHRAPRRAR